jgi:hypothetical protein
VVGQPQLQLVEQLGHGVVLVARHQGRDAAEREHRPGVHGRRRQCVQPHEDRGLTPFAPLTCDGELDQVGCPLDVATGKRVPDRGGRFTGSVVPVTGPTVQGRHLLGPLVAQVGLQHLREQVVVAVPAPGVVERDDEQVGSLQGLEHGPAVLLPGDGVAQRPGEPVEDGGLEKERADVAGLS